MRIGMIAGEASGDVIAAGLIRELRSRHPDAIFEGIGGKHMIAEGFNSLEDMNALSVMGLVEVIKHLPSLLALRKRILAHFLQHQPDVFIGVDAPDFNLAIETQLKLRGVNTVHYISPSVWAWRERRIHKIAKATHMVLGIFPFEQQIYQKYGYPYTFVGHALAEEIPLEVDSTQARQRLSLAQTDFVLALLPGSRAREIESLLPVFLQTAVAFAQRQTITSTLKIMIPAVNQARLQQINRVIEMQGDFTRANLEIRVAEFDSRDVMMASNLVLLASGTASLECMLCKRPMVVAYRLSKLTYIMMKKLYIPKYFALPNILANELIVPEFLQEDVNVDNLTEHLLLQASRDQHELNRCFTRLHLELKCNTSKKAADAIEALVNT